MWNKVDDDADTILSNTSSSLDVPHDSNGDDGDGGDGGGYGEEPPHMMETMGHFPSAG